MRVVEIIPNLRVADIDTARSFYTDFLGLTEQPMGLDWITRFTSADALPLQIMTEDATGGAHPSLTVKVDDVEEAYALAQARGDEIVHDLVTEDWGVRRFFVRAPDGTVLNIAQAH